LECPRELRRSHRFEKSEARIHDEKHRINMKYTWPTLTSSYIIFHWALEYTTLMDKATSPWDCSPTCFISAWGPSRHGNLKGQFPRLRRRQMSKLRTLFVSMLHGVTHSSDTQCILNVTVCCRFGTRCLIIGFLLD
jgi:hypothetical protein